MGKFTCLIAIGILGFGLECCHSQLTSCADVQSCVTYQESAICNALGQREMVCISHVSCFQIITDISAGCANDGRFDSFTAKPPAVSRLGLAIASVLSLARQPALVSALWYHSLFIRFSSANSSSHHKFFFSATVSLGAKSAACTFSSMACSSGGSGFVLSITVTGCDCACSDWSNWGTCSATCGSTAIQARTRTCNPGCLDPTSSTQACPGVPTVCVADGTWNIWGSWSTCSVICGGSTQTRTRTCNRPIGGADCVGISSETQLCGTTVCVADGTWNTWGSWSACSVTCGGSTQTRTRTCNRPTGGADCVGDSSRTQICGTASCPVCTCNPWQNWSVCSVSCGGNAFRTRTRTCSSCVTFMPVLEQTGVCQGVAAECPMDGMWTQWDNWSTCPVTCGGSGQSRMRICTDPTAGGKDCPGSSQESRPCNQLAVATEGGVEGGEGTGAEEGREDAEP
ncbi:coadhesin-like [Watersipora subatra]|uniref:coadhesin-like n=1 Tax=Watersipora subatra TaxID=2589382 RepID=UPI00355C66D9